MSNLNKDLECILEDLDKTIFNTCGDYSKQDAIEVFEKMRSVLWNKVETLQEEISQEVEEISDSFGAGISMRELKGE